MLSKVCEYSITLKRINDIFKEKQNVILKNKIAKISIYIYIIIIIFFFQKI